MSAECTNAPYVAFERAAFGYGEGSLVFADLDLAISAGEYVALLGGNGSGKSTIAKLIDALVQPNAGRVLVFGSDTRDGAETFFIRSNTGLVFQNPDDQIVASIIENEVAFGPENMGVELPELRERVEEALKAVGMQGFERQETAALSGGQKQRVAIAGALAMRPALMVFDEATAMLDPRGRRSLLRLIDELHGRGITIIAITHYMDEAARAERVVVLEEGESGSRVALDGAPEEVFAHAERLHDLDLAVPFASELAVELNRAGVSVAPTVDEEALAEQLEELLPQDGTSSAPLPAASLPNQAGRAKHGPYDEPGITCAIERDSALRDETGADSPAECRGRASHGPLNPEGHPQTDVPLIAFGDVTYSYGDPATDQKRKKRRKGETPGTQVWGAQPGEAPALCGIDLAVNRGEMLGLAGHTGSGKSTLIQHMNGLLHPTAGRVLIDGSDLADKSVAKEARRHVGLVFQYPEHQLFASTVYDDVAFGPRNLGMDPAAVDASVREALEQVGLPAERFAARSPFELSGGQQRKAALAGVLAMGPQVLVLDEPAAGLDPRTRADFLELISRLHADGLTVVMASHSMEDLARLCDRVAVLDKGRLVKEGTPLQVFADGEMLRKAGLAQPAPLRFAERLRESGFHLPARLYDARTLAEAVASQLTRPEGR